MALPRVLALVATVVLTVGLALPSRATAACPPGRGWSSDPVCGNDIVTVGYAGLYGFWISGPRWRWEGLQLETFSLRAARPLVGPYVAQTQGILGVGWKFVLGASRRHEVGFLVYPLSFGLRFERADPHDDSVGECGSFVCALAEGLAGELEAGQSNFLDTRVYYRYSQGLVHVEAGLAMPLLWLKERHGEFDESGPWRGPPPLDLFVGVGL